MAAAKGFWSYVHEDDQADGQRISRLAEDIVAQFGMLTGEPIDLFRDRVAIEWGENWRDKIGESLASVAFFIPVLTPRYFLSPECRNELQFFARRATNLGIKELVLPLLYVNVPALDEEETQDELITLVRTFQWEDWRDLRFADPDSEAYRRGVARLADRLVRANAQAEQTDVAETAAELQKSVAGESDDAPGVLDLMAAAETTMPEWVETMGEIEQQILSIGEIMEAATEDMERADRQGKGFAARLSIARRVARDLAEPAEIIYSSGNKFVSQLQSVDQGFRALIERAPAEIEENPSAQGEVCDFFEMVRKLSVSAHGGLGEIQNFINTFGPIEAASRDLRAPLRRLRQGLTLLAEAREVTDEWVRLIEQSGIDCPEPEHGTPAEAPASG